MGRRHFVHTLVSPVVWSLDGTSVSLDVDDLVEGVADLDEVG